MVSGPRASSPANTPPCSCPQARRVEVKVRLLLSGLSPSVHPIRPPTEATALASISTLAHHGINYIPLGYSTTFPQLANLTEVRGGSPWGAGTFAGPDGSRSPSALELELANLQGKLVWNTVSKVQFPSAA